jgi:hypothetical protein
MEEHAIKKRDDITRLGIDYEYFACKLKRAKGAVDVAAYHWARFFTALPKTCEIIFFVYGDCEKEASIELED